LKSLPSIYLGWAFLQFWYQKTVLGQSQMILPYLTRQKRLTWIQKKVNLFKEKASNCLQAALIIIIIIIIIILCSIDSSDVDAWPTPLQESRHRCLWPLQITITLTESALLIFFCNLGLKNCWHGWPGIEPTTLDLSSQSGAYDLSATATPFSGFPKGQLARIKVMGKPIIYENMQLWSISCFNIKKIFLEYALGIFFIKGTP